MMTRLSVLLLATGTLLHRRAEAQQIDDTTAQCSQAMMYAHRM